MKYFFSVWLVLFAACFPANAEVYLIPQKVEIHFYCLKDKASTADEKQRLYQEYTRKVLLLLQSNRPSLPRLGEKFGNTQSAIDTNDEIYANCAALLQQYSDNVEKLLAWNQVNTQERLDVWSYAMDPILTWRPMRQDPSGFLRQDWQGDGYFKAIADEVLQDNPALRLYLLKLRQSE
ncbi:hypothetical protein [Paralysiella testudinis]|uniref:Uncharacterized protein n=1 Tax=Paralysiella testudinis TaxID=2809020 RepID=A0A892ZKH6_9NEIS|nr:hypothetical protein [Paralysiella testudinis]QRQ83123.1 hypothetical protein JQU52_07140 [Paralysiella testudinis]